MLFKKVAANKVQFADQITSRNIDETVECFMTNALSKEQNTVARPARTILSEHSRKIVAEHLAGTREPIASSRLEEKKGELEQLLADNVL